MPELLTPDASKLVPVERTPPPTPIFVQAGGYSAALSPDQQTITDVIAQVYRGTSVVRHSPLPVQASAAGNAVSNSSATTIVNETINSNVTAYVAGQNVTFTQQGTSTAINSINNGVTSLNALVGAVLLAAGSNVTITPSGNTLTFAAATTSAVPVQVYNSVTITPVSVGTIATTIATLGLTMPSSGGPFRLFINYSGWMNFSGFSNVAGFSCYVSDGLNAICGFTSGQSNASSGAATAVSYGGFSPGTYANSASVTLTLTGIFAAGGGGVFEELPIQGPNSLFQAAVIASN
jgi:hypothetical protein